VRARGLYKDVWDTYQLMIETFTMIVLCESFKCPSRCSLNFIYN